MAVREGAEAKLEVVQGLVRLDEKIQDTQTRIRTLAPLRPGLFGSAYFADKGHSIKVKLRRVTIHIPVQRRSANHL